ncbi:phosphotransferase [Pelagerythrobacter sp.]|uniref:phosphotransferase n=1 Tax=Pelagerythrobacter sp. TaxID=2800702 RepID=UPI0035B2C0E1
MSVLITSGTYIGEEMQAEFGRIPPAFLPVGSSYLVQHQLRRLGEQDEVWLSLPADFAMDAALARLLEAEGVRIIRIDPTKSLGMSVFQSILEIGADGPLQIVHGDTLVTPPETPPDDCLSIAGVVEQYSWGLVTLDGERVRAVASEHRGDRLTEESLMLSGYFRFSDTAALLKCLSRSDFGFVSAIDRYCRDHAVAGIAAIEALDFGHLKTYYSSRYRLAAARHFNTLSIDGYTVHKKSRDAAKLDAEANWLRSVPAALQPYTARLIETRGAPQAGEYRTVYANFPTVAELYLARSSRFVWQKILAGCREYLDAAARFEGPGETPLAWLVIDKLRERLGQYPGFLPAADERLTINGAPVGTLEDIVARLAETIAAAPARAPAIMHGDFCFSNMLFDVRSDRIVLIDPRGAVRGEQTIFGDIRYDIAKLGHSIVGRYDQIVAEHLVAECDATGRDFTLEVPGGDALREWLEERFFAASAGGAAFDEPAVRAAMVSLFLSMIPLHADNPKRQRTLFANALRLHARFFGE